MHGTVVHRKLRFGPFELSIGERVLRRDGRVLPLGDRALDILTYLADRPGEVIAKHELMDHIWSDVTVEEGSLRVHVAAIRKALGDGQFGNRYIANIKGRGYSFVGTVAVAAGHDADVRLIAALVHALKALRVDPSGTVWVMVSTIPVDSTSSDTTCPHRRVD
jgi:DNA-binding winged helix-turn-helix (wHTH) protein